MSEIQNSPNWKPKFLISGTAVGALIGLAAAYLLAQSAEEEQGGPPAISTNDMLKAGVSIIGVVRGIASLGKK
jgi:hypothetical protein